MARCWLRSGRKHAYQRACGLMFSRKCLQKCKTMQNAHGEQQDISGCCSNSISSFAIWFVTICNKILVFIPLNTSKHITKCSCCSLNCNQRALGDLYNSHIVQNHCYHPIQLIVYSWHMSSNIRKHPSLPDWLLAFPISQRNCMLCYVIIEHKRLMHPVARPE